MTTRRARIAIAAVGMLFAAGSTAVASGSGNQNVRLSGYEEDPQIVSSTGTGLFRARIDDAKQEISYRLSYSALEGTVSQSHLHLGGKAQSGGITVFLCSNLGNGPVGTQACPAAPGNITGTIKPADVLAVAPAGVAAGEFAELVKAIRAGVVYVNVHSSKHPPGEIRGQLGHQNH